MKQALPLVVILLAVSGCDTLGVQGDASMRVEVEVYNGPLSKDLDTQNAELIAMLLVAETAMRRIERDAKLSQCRLGCFGAGSKSVRPTNLRRLLGRTASLTTFASSSEKASKDKFRDKSDHGMADKFLSLSECNKVQDIQDYILANSSLSSSSAAPGNKSQLWRDNYEFTTTFEDHHVQLCPSLNDLEFVANAQRLNIEAMRATFSAPLNRDQVVEVASLGAVFTNVALLLTAEEIRVPSDSRRARTEFAQFANVTAELGKSLTNRADALLQQLPPSLGDPVLRKPADRRTLPNNLYLSTASPTEFSYLHEWIDSGTEGDNSVRTKSLQRLINDNNWAKVNTVFAYGRGKARMAFIKDDIGNWDLKSFESDPAELLDAYKNVGLAALKGAAKLAKKASTGGVKIESLAETAQRFALGVGPSEATNGSFATLKQHTVTQLQGLQTRYQQAWIDAQAAVEKSENTVSSLQQATVELKDQVDVQAARQDSAQREVVAGAGATPEEREALLSAFANETKALTQFRAQYDTRVSELEAEKQKLTQITATRDALPVQLQVATATLLQQYKGTIELLQQSIVDEG